MNQQQDIQTSCPESTYTVKAGMRICVPLLSNAVTAVNDDLQVARHFGLAKRFAVIDSASGNIVGECSISGQCPGACHCPLPNLIDSQVEALAGQSMGFRLMQLSKRAGLPILSVHARTLGEFRNEIRKKWPTRPLTAAICLTNARGHAPNKAT